MRKDIIRQTGKLRLDMGSSAASSFQIQTGRHEHAQAGP